MIRTEELLKLAEAAIKPRLKGDLVEYEAHCMAVNRLIDAANPETIKQLVELVLLQHEALKEMHGHVEYNGPEDEVGGHSCCYSLSYRPHEQDCKVSNAIAAFNKFEGGE